MIKFEEMPPSAQKSYNRANSVRKVFMFIGWGCLLFWIAAAISDKENSFASFSSCVTTVLMIFMNVGFLSGIAHGAFTIKKIFNKYFSIIFFPISFAMILFVTTMLGIFTGGVFLIADTISFFKKKPLIYQFEMHNFLESEKAQAEIKLESYNSANDDSLYKIQQLKNMLENGAITEEEFKQKKEQLLSKV